MDANPKTMLAVILEKPDDRFIIKAIPVPEPNEQQLLVKMEATTINPSDFFHIKGHNFPTQIGLEGFGTVVKAGSPAGEKFIGKKVAFWSMNSKTWAEYSVVGLNEFMEVDKDLPPEKGACAYLNPVTSIGLIDTVKSGNHKGVIITTASTCSKIMFKLCKEEGIKTIAVVRKDEQKKICLDHGADVALNSTDNDFEEQLKKYATEFHATALIECILGEITGKIMRNMPPQSVTIIYGNLSLTKTLNIDIMDLMWNQRMIRTQMFFSWLSSQSEEKREQVFKKIRASLDSTCKTDIAKVFKLDEVNEAYDYYLKNMSSGKVVIKI